MVPLLPPYPDEALFSAVIRTSLYYHFPPEKIFAKLRGVPSYTNDGLCTVASLLNFNSPYWGISPRTILERHTLVPFYGATLNKAAYEAGIAGCIAGGSDVATSLRSAGWRIGARAGSRRFCPRCALEDARLYGTSYWRREHLLPYILVCAKHHCSLNGIVECGRSEAAMRTMPLETEARPVYQQSSAAEFESAAYVSNTFKSLLVAPPRFSTADLREEVVRCLTMGGQLVMARTFEVERYWKELLKEIPGVPKTASNLMDASLDLIAGRKRFMTSAEIGILAIGKRKGVKRWLHPHAGTNVECPVSKIFPSLRHRCFFVGRLNLNRYVGDRHIAACVCGARFSFRFSTRRGGRTPYVDGWYRSEQPLLDFVRSRRFSTIEITNELSKMTFSPRAIRDFLDPTAMTATWNYAVRNVSNDLLLHGSEDRENTVKESRHSSTTEAGTGLGGSA